MTSAAAKAEPRHWSDPQLDVFLALELMAWQLRAEMWWAADGRFAGYGCDLRMAAQGKYRIWQPSQDHNQVASLREQLWWRQGDAGVSCFVWHLQQCLCEEPLATSSLLQFRYIHAAPRWQCEALAAAWLELQPLAL